MTDAVDTSALAAPAPASMPDPLRGAVDATIARAVGERWAERLWERDTSLWTSDPAVAAKITERLGWLDAPTRFTDEVEELEAFGGSIAAEGFSHAIVCGMGGSSLAPDVLAHAFPRAQSGLDIRVLDSTDPVAVAEIGPRQDDARALHVIATKSGTTTETLAFLAYFWDLVEKRTSLFRRGHVGDSFVAITDPDESVKAIPHSGSFRGVFLNPPDVGGRYSALTYVGLIPASLMGLQIGELLGDAAEMAGRCRPNSPRNPGLALGATIGTLAVQGRDKLTFVLEPALAEFGGWVEQLIAESTGKHGIGIVPVDGEALGTPEVYGQDRVFVRIARNSEADWRAATGAKLEALGSAGHPVIDIVLRDGEWLGGEFFRWEFATAIAGVVLGINPFDEPNVAESKENTRVVLERFHHEGHLPEDEPLVSEGRLTLVGDAALRLSDAGGNAAAQLRRHLDRARPNGYHAIQAYIAPSPGHTDALRAIQALLRDGTHRATTMGYGPRFLHSTGQLHKGGARTGCFLQLVADHPADLPIPGRKESFGTLIDAQARGDFASLQSHELPVLRVHLSDDPDAGLAELRTALEAALA